MTLPAESWYGWYGIQYIVYITRARLVSAFERGNVGAMRCWIDCLLPVLTLLILLVQAIPISFKAYGCWSKYSRRAGTRSSGDDMDKDG